MKLSDLKPYLGLLGVIPFTLAFLYFVTGGKMGMTEIIVAPVGIILVFAILLYLNSDVRETCGSIS